MQHEGATLGIMITTSGYGPGSEEFANGKPLHLIDDPGLISICQEHGIPARILGLGTRRRAAQGPAGDGFYAMGAATGGLPLPDPPGTGRRSSSAGWNRRSR